jgi:uncharacterized integral membrane protein (TIGR00698 family)
MIYGIVLSSLLAILSVIINDFLLIGAVSISIILGILFNNTFKIPSIFSPGITYSEKSILSFAIALMGINLDFNILSALGVHILILIISAMILTLFTSLLLGKIFKLDTKFALMLGIGNAVCGASAIGATKDIVKAKEDEVGISVALVNLMGTIGIFLVPSMALLLGFDDTKAGVLVGNTLQAVGQAVAGGFSISDESGQSATVTKMVRVLMLTPLITILLFVYAKKAINEKPSSKSVFKNIPIYIFAFTIFSIIATFIILPEHIITTISMMSKYTLVISMAAIGLKIKFKSILKNGSKALIIVSILFVVQIIYSASFLLFLE